MKLPDQPLWVSGDPVRLSQVVSNLLTNAVKFTDAGGTVTLQLRRDAGKGAAVLSAKDTGVGIEADDARAALHSRSRRRAGASTAREGAWAWA